MNETIDKDNPIRDRNIGGNYITDDQAGGKYSNNRDKSIY
jgi:hypothetical protein